MGNSTSVSTANMSIRSIKLEMESPKATTTTLYGTYPKVTRKKNKTHKAQSLLSLYPYLTYHRSLNTFSQSLNLLQSIAKLISEYMGNKQIIKNETFELYIHVKKSNQRLIANNMLCGCSWNGLVYLIAPANNNATHANWYMIDEYSAPSKQITMKELDAKSILFDTRLCCVISHIVSYTIPYKLMCDPMIIDGIIFCNQGLNIIYGYSIVNGLFVIKQFTESEPMLKYNYLTQKYHIKYMDGWMDEKVVHLWRQNLDCFVLTNKFNLYGIKVTQTSFQICKIRKYISHDDTDAHCVCWYDINTKALLVIDSSGGGAFKVYRMDKTCELRIPHQLESQMNQYFDVASRNQFLFHHKASDTLLFLFGSYIVEMDVDFERVKFKRVNMGKIKDFNTFEMSLVHQMEHDGFKMNVSNVVVNNDDRYHNPDVVKLMMKIKSSSNLSICDFICGYDELKSCIVIDLNECTKKLERVYKFKILLISIHDFEILWKQLI
eukprot:193387_1